MITSWKRGLTFGAAISAIALSLTGCGAAAPSDGKIHLTMWQQWGGGHERDVLDALIERYEAENPNITIEETPMTNNAKILAAITGGNAPDIIDVGNSLPLGAWASAGAVTDLTPYIEQSGMDTSLFVESAFSAMQVDGKTFALPFQIYNAGLIYNTRLFDEAGIAPPTTLEELATAAEALTITGADGSIQQLGFAPNYPGPDQGQTCPLISYAYAFGGNWVDSSGAATPDDPANVAALTWMKDLYEATGGDKVTNFLASSGSYLTGDDPLESGKVAMSFDGPWSIQYAKDNAPDVAAELAVIPLPGSAVGGQPGSTYIDANAHLIPAGAKNPQAAFDFLAWMATNPEETAIFSNAIANIPQLKDVPDYELMTDPNYAEFVKIANGPGARGWVQTETSSAYGTTICQAQDAVLLNDADPAEALAGVQTK